MNGAGAVISSKLTSIPLGTESMVTVVVSGRMSMHSVPVTPLVLVALAQSST